LLEQANFLLGKGIGLGNDGNQVDLLVKPPHEFDIDWLKPAVSAELEWREQISLRVASRLDEIDTSVNTVINQFQPVDPVFLLKVGVKSSINVVDNGFPAGSSALGAEGPKSSPLIVIDEITKSGSINDRQLQSNASLLNI
jgi:hypothetical protein